MVEIATGTDNIRDAVFARQNQIVIIARNAGISASLLDAFMRGNSDLDVPALDALCFEIWHGSVIFDPDADMLCPAPAQPAKPLGTAPQYAHSAVFINGEALAPFTPGPAQRGGPTREPAPAAKPKPGWRGVW